ncbi:hypothetical protein GMSM_25660 [Geomonas sp. Red276]
MQGKGMGDGALFAIGSDHDHFADFRHAPDKGGQPRRVYTIVIGKQDLQRVPLVNGIADGI